MDSDWAADLDSRRSHTGCVLMMSGGAVFWNSRWQDCVWVLEVSLSTSEAEYVVASQCGHRRYWEILRDFGYAQEAPRCSMRTIWRVCCYVREPSAQEILASQRHSILCCARLGGAAGDEAYSSPYTHTRWLQVD